MVRFDYQLTSFKGTFFDRHKVTDPVERMWRRNLSRFGAFVRQRSKTSIRYSKRPAPAGQPPHAHRTATKAKKNKKTGVVKVQPVSLLREFIFFGYEASANTVVIGPALLRGTRSKTTSASTIPELLEHGGEAQIEQDKQVGWKSVGRERIPITARSTKPARYSPRPFMRPAADKETPKFMASLKDSVK